VSYEMPLTDRELVEAIREEIVRRIGEGYYAVITVDREYTSNRYGSKKK